MSDIKTVFAGLRDASWYRCPNVRTVKQYHIVLENGDAACNSKSILINDEGLIPAAKVKESHRCKRPGCKSRWPSL